MRCLVHQFEFFSRSLQCFSPLQGLVGPKWSSWFANKPINQWPDNEGYNTMHHDVRILNVVNDVAERSI